MRESIADRKVEWIEVGGKSIPAEKALCPVCNTLDLGTGFNTKVEPWIAECPEVHEWEIKTTPDA